MATNCKKTSNDTVNPSEKFSFRVAVIQTVITFLTLVITKTIAVRCISMLLIALGFSNKIIASLTGSCVRTVRDLRKKMLTDLRYNLSELLKLKSGSGRKNSVPKEIQQAIVEEVDKNNYSTLKQIDYMVKRQFGIVVSEKILGRILKSFGSVRRKVESFPGKTNTKDQQEHYHTKLLPAIEQTKHEKFKLLFCDGSHFVLSFRFLGYLYGRFRKIVNTFTGKKRYNVLGALDYATKELITIASEKNLNHESVIELLKKIALKYNDCNIVMVLDRARYQFCKDVKRVAYQLGITLQFLPPYSPNLNLIERVWKLIKSKLRVRYYDNFSLFVAEIDKILIKVNTEYKEEMETLIGEKFHFYDDLQQVSEGTFKRNSEKLKINVS